MFKKLIKRLIRRLNTPTEYELSIWALGMATIIIGFIIMGGSLLIYTGLVWVIF